MIVWMEDPERISEFHFGGPHFREFTVMNRERLRCVQSGDVFCAASVIAGRRNHRNVAPLEE